MRSPKSRISKNNDLFKTITKKYPGTAEQEDPRYKKSFRRTPPGQESTDYIPHRVFSMIHPHLNRSVIKGIKKLQSTDLSDAQNFGDLASDLARSTLSVYSPHYISDPRKTVNKIKWRNYFK